MTIAEFIERWRASGAAERANKDSFLNELCDVLGVPRPDPKANDPERDLYVFEMDVPRFREDGRSIGRIDLYKADCFVLEAKQVADRKRDTPAWNQAMNDACGQALGYARSLKSPPPFVVVCDIGYCFDVYESFDGSGAYRPFPDGRGKRLFLKDLGDHVGTLRAIWTDPHSLDPSKRQAAITREVAARIAKLARELEASGQPPESVARFLMRCLFTMFAEDVGLLEGKPLSRFLAEYWIPHPESFPGGIGALWRAMNDGGDTMAGKVLRFNGGLFRETTALALDTRQLELLADAANCDWSEVDPSIFGTLLERALDPTERHRLGAHYTPRAYVERLVKPTIEEPLRGDWDLVRAEVRTLVEEGKEKEAQKRVVEFHRTLCATRVLDPACGTGNFLYVTLDLFKRLESEVLEMLRGLGYGQVGLEMERYSVTPEQFRGIEVKPWAKEIAELVLWIGYLQWQVRQTGEAKTIPEPVLRDYQNIECRDAVLAWDGEPELVRDDKGAPVTRWDGVSTKTSPITGEEIPDESKTIPLYRYNNPRPAEWPKADFIIGNPPYIGNKRMRLALGDGYAEALRAAHKDVPETADFVMYWWNHAANLVSLGKARRFGLITTNSITQSFNRSVVERFLRGSPGASIAYAVPDHPWVDNEGGAAVRVTMTVAQGVAAAGELSFIERESPLEDGSRGLALRSLKGIITSRLRIGVDTTDVAVLRSNLGLGFMGVIPVGTGFRIEPKELDTFGLRLDELPPVVRKYLNGRDVINGDEARLIIDFFGRSLDAARSEFPVLLQIVQDRVKPGRDVCKRQQHREKWWVFGEARPAMREALSGLERFVATVETSKHRFFVFLDGRILPDQKLRVVASEDAFLLAVLSSRVHLVWCSTVGGRLEDRPVWNNSTCLDPFPFPNPSRESVLRIRALGEQLDAHRKARQAEHPGLTITGMYNVLEKLRSGETFTAKEKLIHEQGLVSVLKQIHDELDEAVFEAYGWPADLSDEEILERLVALNHERAEEEARGIVRWLRPEFQNPDGTRDRGQAELEGVETAKTKKKPKTGAAKVEKRPWPKELPARVAAAREALAEAGTLDLGSAKKLFAHSREESLTTALDSLVALGLAVRSEDGGAPTWTAVQ